MEGTQEVEGFPKSPSWVPGITLSPQVAGGPRYVSWTVGNHQKKTHLQSSFITRRVFQGYSRQILFFFKKRFFKKFERQWDALKNSYHLWKAWFGTILSNYMWVVSFKEQHSDYYPHFSNEDTEAQRCDTTAPGHTDGTKRHTELALVTILPGSRAHYLATSLTHISTTSTFLEITMILSVLSHFLPTNLTVLHDSF